MDIDVQHVEIVQTGGAEHFLVTATVDGADTHVMAMPTDILETRAAEFNVPVTDTDLLLDIVLHEPFLPPLGDDDPDNLYNADTLVDARKAHLARIAKVKGKGRVRGITGDAPYKAAGPGVAVIDNSGTGDPVAFLKDRAYLSAEHAAVKREHIRRTRDKDAPDRAERKRRRTERVARPDAQSLRDALLGASTDPAQPPTTAPPRR